MSNEETLSDLALRHVEESLKLQELFRMQADHLLTDGIEADIQEQKALVADLYEQIRALTFIIDNSHSDGETTEID
jgi:hypothetical protein